MYQLYLKKKLKQNKLMPQLTPRDFDSVCGMAWISGFFRCSLGDSVGQMKLGTNFVSGRQSQE